MDRVVDKSARFHLWIRCLERVEPLGGCVKEKRAAIFCFYQWFSSAFCCRFITCGRILKLVHLTPNIEYMFKLPFDSFPSSSIKYLDKKIFQLKRREKRCKIVSIYSWPDRVEVPQHYYISLTVSFLPFFKHHGKGRKSVIRVIRETSA